MKGSFGKYVLHERIGVGGMAEVWRATLPGAGGIDKPCVLKRILPHFAEDTAMVEMFLDEARVSISLQHGNIVPILDFGEIDGKYYLAMEHVAGSNLRSVLLRLSRQRAQFPIPLAAFVLIEVCRGLAYAHAKARPDGRPLGLVHRDVSPSNILLSFEGDVRLADFGIAKVQSKTIQTDVLTLKGKIPYMSPEQASGKPVDTRTDIFAAGVVLYEMLAAQRPFVGRDQLETLELVRAGRFEPLRTVRPEVPEDLEEIVHIALAKDRESRFQEVRAMQVVLSRFLLRHDSTLTSADLKAFLSELLPEEVARASASRAQEDPTESLHDPFESALMLEAEVSGNHPRTGTQATAQGPRAVASPPRRAVLERDHRPAGDDLTVHDEAPSLASTTTGISLALRKSVGPRARNVGVLLTVACTAAGLIVASVFGLGNEPAPDRPPPIAPREVSSPKLVRPEEGPRVADAGVADAGDVVPVVPVPDKRRVIAGVLRIHSTPWASVYVDGRLRANGTPASLELPVGRHGVRLVSPGFQPVIRTVTIRANADTPLAVTLVPLEP